MALTIRGISLGNPDDTAAIAIQRGGKKPEHIRRYAAALWEACRELGVRADVAFAQADLETGDRHTGVGFSSTRWFEEGNPAGLGIVTGMPDNEAGQTFEPEAWAVIHATHLAGYAGIDPPEDWKTLDFRWQPMIDAGYFGVAETVDDLDGRWATSTPYGSKIAARHALYGFATQNPVDAVTDAVGGVVGTIVDIITRVVSDALGGKKEDTDMEQRYVLSMGHRNHDRGGARGEYDWTPWATRALKAAIEKRGGKAFIIQEERGTGSYYNGGLQAAARACVDLARTHGPFKAYLSMHYDSSPGFHAIFPNGANDTKAMNPLDVRLCEAMVKRVRATNTVPIKSWTRHAPGVMDEKETWVGSQGYRLGEFVGTLGFRATTARVILEASGVGDERYIHNENWVKNIYCESVVDALEDVFGKMGGAQPPKPEPEPEYAKADPIAEVASMPAHVKLDNKARLVYTGYTVRAKRDTPRLKHAWPGSDKIGPDVKAGETFPVSYLIINADDTLYYYTPWHTRFAFDDVEPLFADVDES